MSLVGHAEQLAIAEACRSGDRRGRRQQAEHGTGADRLARAGLADDGDDLAGGDVEADAVDGVDLPCVGAERHREVRERQRGHAFSAAASSAADLDGRLDVAGELLELVGDLGLVGGRRLGATRAQQRVEDVVEALADQRHAEHDQDDRGAGEHAGPPDAVGGIGQRLVEVEAPLGGGRRLDAEAEEAQAGQRQDRLGRVERADDRQVLRDVGEDVAAEDARRAYADDAGRVDVRLDLDREGRAADHAVVLRHEHDRDRDGRREDAAECAAGAAGEDDRHDDRQQQGREGVQGIHDQHEDAVEPAAEESGQQAERYADQARQHDREDDDLERGPGAEDDAGQHVGATDGRTEPVGGRRCLLGAEEDTAGHGRR